MARQLLFAKQYHSEQIRRMSEIGGACSKHNQEKWMHDFCFKTWSKETAFKN